MHKDDARKTLAGKDILPNSWDKDDCMMFKVQAI